MLIHCAGRTKYTPFQLYKPNIPCGAANQKKSFLLKEGDQLYDGDVVSINRGEVVFKQIVQDPTALKPFREVVKSLNPS